MKQHHTANRKTERSHLLGDERESDQGQRPTTLGTDLPFPLPLVLGLLAFLLLGWQGEASFVPAPSQAARLLPPQTAWDPVQQERGGVKGDGGMARRK